MERKDIEVVAVNDVFEADYAAYLLKYDSVHRTYRYPITVQGDTLHLNNKQTKILSIMEPSKLPWKELNVDYVIEATGRFTTKEDLEGHIKAGAKKVVLTAPAKGDDVPTFVLGVNEQTYNPSKDNIVSNASCTTNCLAPLTKILLDNFGIEEGLMTTIHALTSSQPTVDGPSKKDWRGGRSALVNIIPSSTGAAKAVGLCLPQVKGKLTGLAMRVPVVDVSCVDLTVRTTKKTSYDEVSATVKKAAQNEMKGIVEYCDEPVVSSDYIGSSASCIYDKKAGIGLNDHFFKFIAWYDNEYGYSTRVVDMIEYMARR